LKLFDIVEDIFFHAEIIGIEPGVYQAIFAVRIVNFFEVGIFNPILPVIRPSKCNDDMICVLSVPRVGIDSRYGLADEVDVCENQRTGAFAGPRDEALWTAEGHSG
jgi:hypothetical protein